MQFANQLLHPLTNNVFFLLSCVNFCAGASFYRVIVKGLLTHGSNFIAPSSYSSSSWKMSVLFDSYPIE